MNHKKIKSFIYLDFRVYRLFMFLLLIIKANKVLKLSGERNIKKKIFFVE